jgi:hypothetical protein
VCDDFEQTATHMGRLIISELFLPSSVRTIKPLDVGGTLGGVKFCQQVTRA